MDINHPHNQSYWFVLREDQSNVIISNNNFTIQNPQIAAQEARYIVDTGERQYIQINESPIVLQETVEEQKDIIVRKDEDFWRKDKVKLLLTLCLENGLRSNTKDKTFWLNISANLGTSPEECCKKYKNLRRTFIRLLKKKRSGKDVKWIHYSLCEEVFKECKSMPAALLEPWDEHKVRWLLTLYLENLNKFRKPSGLKKDVWREIAIQLGTTEYNCYHKFKNLKRSYLNWKEKHRQTGKPIMWQYFQYFERIFHDYNPNISWNSSKTRLLVDAYKQIAEKFKNPRYQKKELWKEISMSIGESPTKCDKKFRNLKQTYIRLKMRADCGRLITKWKYYKDFESIYSAQSTYTQQHYDDTPKTLHTNYKEYDYIKELLTFYLENKERFKDPLLKKKNIWRLISKKLGLSTDECDRKFRNLKQTYLRLAEKKKEGGKTNNWPYYSYFEKIFDEPRASANTQSVNGLSLSRLYSLIQEVHNRKEKDKFEVLVRTVEESNRIQRERNKILQALLDRRQH